MALTASFKQTFGTVSAYHYLSQYSVNREDGSIKLKVDLFESADARAAWKAAHAAIPELQAKIRDFTAERDILQGKQPRTADLQKQIAAAGENITKLEEDLKTAMETSAKNARAPEPIFVTVPPGAIPESADGGITPAAIYAWLKAERFSDAKDA
ncbi:MAG TPA: hypothetical protein VIM56_03755 [Rhizomicrobium sp.]